MHGIITSIHYIVLEPRRSSFNSIRMPQERMKRSRFNNNRWSISTCAAEKSGRVSNTSTGKKSSSWTTRNGGGVKEDKTSRTLLIISKIRNKRP